MTKPTTETSPTDESSPADGVLRRTVLKASAATVGALGMSVPVGAIPTAPRDAGGHSEQTAEVDSPVGFGVEILAGHANFPDDVSAKFKMQYDGGRGTIVSNLQNDASSVIFARVTWAPDGTSGWHTHPGPVVVSVAEGELTLVNERDCIPRTYAAGEAFIDPGQGNVHIASNASSTNQAVAYATFFGVPDGQPATVWVPPVNC